MSRLGSIFQLNVKGRHGAGEEIQVLVVKRSRREHNLACSQAHWFPTGCSYQCMGQRHQPWSWSHHSAWQTLIYTQSTIRCLWNTHSNHPGGTISPMMWSRSWCLDSPDPTNHVHPRKPQQRSSQQPPGWRWMTTGPTSFSGDELQKLL